MPINTDLDVAPYFDDYDETKNYHRVLFRPSVAVQARELTQLQSILQNQIERFGDWAFRNGDIVSGCTIMDMPCVPYVRLMDFASNGSANVAALDVRDYINAVATSVTSGLKAQVVYANAGFSTNYPDNNILYIRYLNTGDNGEDVFSNAELLTFEMVTTAGNVALSNVYTWANTKANTVATGNSHGLMVTEGIVFVGGNFVRVPNSTFGLVNTFGTNAGNNVVGFQLIEEIITENQDETLFDNALGYTNENAPGAHRLRLLPTLVSLTPEAAAQTKGFNPIASFNYGTLVTKAVVSSNVYSIIGDVIEKRTYEESGNYVVNPFTVDTITNIANTSISPPNSNAVLGRIGTGVGYAQGSRVELLKTSYINMRRGTDVQTNLSQLISFNYGGYFILNEVSGSFDFAKSQTVTLYDTYQKTATNRTYSSATVTGTAIGTAVVRCFSYASGTPGLNVAQYYLHVYNIKMNAGYNTNQIKSVYYNGTTKAYGDLVSPGLKDFSSKRQIYSFGVSGLKNLRDSSNNVHSEYLYRYKTSGTMTTTGNVTITITSSSPGGTDQLPFGNGMITDAAAATFTLVSTANVDSALLTGTVSVNTTSVNVVGTSTTFGTLFYTGDIIKVGSDIRTVNVVSNNTFMTVDNPFGTTNAAANFYKSYLKGKIIPISHNATGPNGYINVKNSTSFDISSGQFPSTSLGVDVVYNILRTTTLPASKAIKKNRFVKINTATNPNGPWCLGFSDIHKVSKIYGTSNGTYTTAGVDLTSNFTYDTGQRDTHYDYGYLYAKGSYTSTSYPNLLVQLDYFAANTATGVGFFTVESYPIDDANTANTLAIQTKDIPLYVDELGNKIPLRDVVDFRTPSTPTANDTGVVDTSNSTQMTTAISYATTNPSATLTLSTGDATRGLNIPSYAATFKADYTRYLPRKDLVLITPDNVIKVKEGLSSPTPQTPLYPENSMTLAVLNVPPYPSLSTDQVEEFLTINQSSKNVIRDTSLAISSSIVTNRRYTMKDIGTLDQRITNIEYYTQLSLLEKKAKDLTVTDAYGLDRFKNGIFVDPFTDFILGDVTNPEYSIAIDTTKGIARPKIVREIVNIKFNSSASSNVSQTGRLVTLSYTEVPFLVQQYATKYRSSALVAFSWNGHIIMIPGYDNNVDLNQTGSLNVTIDNSAPWKEFAASPFGSLWGDWRTSTTTVANSVITGQVNNLLYNWNGALLSSTAAATQPANSVTTTTTYANGLVMQTNSVAIPAVPTSAANANPGAIWSIGNQLNTLFNLIRTSGI